LDTTAAATPRKRSRKTGEKRNPRATRRALLGAGARLFSAKGYDAVSVEDLARRARVNKALISYHFGSKRGLYVAVLESGFGEMAKRLRVVTEAADAREGLHRFFKVFGDMTRRRSDFPALFLREAVTKGIEPAVTPHLLEIMGITRGLAERGHREGLFRKVDPILFHFSLVGALGFFFATEPARLRAATQVPFEMPTPQTFIRHLEEMTLRGFAPEPPTAAKRTSTTRKGART
jgi:TetR/AcrR family transcriptional regulator